MDLKQPFTTNENYKEDDEQNYKEGKAERVYEESYNVVTQLAKNSS